jgi:hypothetical protein
MRFLFDGILQPTLTCSPTSRTSSVVRFPTSTLTKSAGSLSRMSMLRRPYSRSFLPIELERPEKKAIVVDESAAPLVVRRATRAATVELESAP